MLDSTFLPLRTDRAILRAMLPQDAAAYAAGTADPAVRQFAHLPEPEYTETSVRTFIEGTIQEGLDRGDLAVLTIADPDSDDFAGSLVLFDVEGDTVEVGFWVHPEHRGGGKSGAALHLAADFVRSSGFTTLKARTVVDNAASQQVLERSGFIRADTVRDTTPAGQDTVLIHYHRQV